MFAAGAFLALSLEPFQPPHSHVLGQGRHLSLPCFVASCSLKDTKSGGGGGGQAPRGAALPTSPAQGPGDSCARAEPMPAEP